MHLFFLARLPPGPHYLQGFLPLPVQRVALRGNYHRNSAATLPPHRRPHSHLVPSPAWRTENSLPPSDGHSREGSMTWGFTCLVLLRGRQGGGGVSEQRRISSSTRSTNLPHHLLPLFPSSSSADAGGQLFQSKAGVTLFRGHSEIRSPLGEMSPSTESSALHLLTALWNTSGVWLLVCYSVRPSVKCVKAPPHTYKYTDFQVHLVCLSSLSFIYVCVYLCICLCLCVSSLERDKRLKQMILWF